MTAQLILKPRVSEKAYAQSEKLNTYVFDIGRQFNTLLVAQAVARKYNVTVLSVRLASTAAKSRRLYKKRGQATTVSRSGLKKAYVTLKAGDKLPFFAEDEKASKKKSEEKR